MHIFKSDLKNIEIDRKENKDFGYVDLIMVYDDYKVHAEFESTGIKNLFVYLPICRRWFMEKLFSLMNLIQICMMFICVIL